MAKRKPTEIVQLRLRLPEKLRKMIEVEARKNDWSLNRELVRRLERSFVDQGVEALIQSTGQVVARQVGKDVVAHLDGVIDEFNRIYLLLGRPDLAIKLESTENSND